MLTTNLAVTLVANHVHRPRRVDGSFQLPEGVPEGDSFNTPRGPAPRGCIAKSNAYLWLCSRPKAFTLRAMSQALTLHNPCVQCLSGYAFTVLYNDEPNSVGP